MKFLIISFLLVTSVFARSPATELEETTKDLSEVLEGQTAELPLYLNTIRVRTSLEAGIQIPGVTNATLSPEIELFFTR